MEESVDDLADYTRPVFIINIIDPIGFASGRKRPVSVDAYELLKETDHYLFVSNYGLELKMAKRSVKYAVTREEAKAMVKELLNKEKERARAYLASLDSTDSIPLRIVPKDKPAKLDRPILI